MEFGRQRTQNPITTGASVLGIVYDSGVMLASDSGVSYGSMAMFRDQTRLVKVSDYTVGGSTGEFADHQYLLKLIEDLQIQEETSMDGNKYSLSPLALHTWLTRVLYNRRSRMDPLWTTWIIGGIVESTGKPFLGYVDKIGTAYTDNLIATGFGAHLAKPLMRAAVESKNGQPLTEAEARALLNKCMTVLFCRDCQSWPKYNIAVVRRDAQGKVSSVVEDHIDIDANWEIADFI